MWQAQEGKLIKKENFMHRSARKNIDLNLLKVLAAISAHKSVNGAAHELGLSQPAASHALKRLRDATGDAIITRSGNGYSLTSYAQIAGEAARTIMDQIHGTLFEPTAQSLPVIVAPHEFAHQHEAALAEIIATAAVNYRNFLVTDSDPVVEQNGAAITNAALVVGGLEGRGPNYRTLAYHDTLVAIASRASKGRWTEIVDEKKMLEMYKIGLFNQAEIYPELEKFFKNLKPRPEINYKFYEWELVFKFTEISEFVSFVPEVLFSRFSKRYDVVALAAYRNKVAITQYAHVAKSFYKTIAPIMKKHGFVDA
jgi:molybdenum-dependent DNA-binding transcriptional regulator ModE